MTSSEMAKVANANRRKKLGKKGYQEYMRKMALKGVKARVDKYKKDQQNQTIDHTRA